MEYKKLDKTAYNLHLIKTNKFKTINVRICFRDEIKKEDITIRNMLTNFMTYSTDTYKTKRDLVLKTQDLYAASIYTRCYRSGRYNMTNFYLSILSEKYTEKGMLEESLKLFSDIIFNPNFNDKDHYLEIYKFLFDAYEKKLENIKDNSTGYSMIRMLEEMDKTCAYSYRDIGYLDDLKKITLEDMKAYHKRLLNNSLIDIFIIGDINDDIEKLIEKYFDFKTFKSPKVNQIIVHNKVNSKPKEIKEKNKSNQSKLSIGCKVYDLSEFERNYVLTLYNLLIGGSSESKFFQIIREKNSLCYHISSSLNKLDSLMLIKAGISRKNYDKTIKLVKELMKDMENGNFTNDEINMAKTNYISMLNEIEDNEDAIVETYMAKDLLNLGDIDERKREIMRVTKEDIIKLAKKVKIDTIFLLEGVNSHE